MQVPTENTNHCQGIINVIIIMTNTVQYTNIGRRSLLDDIQRRVCAGFYVELDCTAEFVS